MSAKVAADQAGTERADLPPSVLPVQTGSAAPVSGRDLTQWVAERSSARKHTTPAGVEGRTTLKSSQELPGWAGT